MSSLCPCGSGKLYEVCCRPFHYGARAATALELMRSRYSAYAMQHSGYIIETTHPLNPSVVSDLLAWAAEILAFAKSTHFERLEILEFQDGDHVAYVSFTAYLKQGGSDVSFTETSRFEKMGGVWLYREGCIKPPKKT